MAFRASVLTLYPEMFPGILGESLSGKALARGDVSIEPIQIRDFATDRHRSVDDTPAGGGAGMVLRPCWPPPSIHSRTIRVHAC